MLSTIRDRSLQKAINATITAIADGYKPKKIIMFGSFARGDYHHGSDLDLIIVKNTEQKFLRRMDRIADLCPEGITVEAFVYTEKEMAEMLSSGNRFLETALEEGKVVYEEQQSD
ncbi:MAG: nucleotidyltransferase domain-containing protein [Chloroflexi bacterium]|nr:nucleotidyltransferase domain-containing protein [Chloroflexota bacterium]